MAVEVKITVLPLANEIAAKKKFSITSEHGVLYKEEIPRNEITTLVILLKSDFPP